MPLFRGVPDERPCAWDHKDLAVEHAKQLAQEAAKGQVIVHGKDGTIQEEFTYGDDPRNIPG